MNAIDNFEKFITLTEGELVNINGTLFKCCVDFNVLEICQEMQKYKNATSDKAPYINFADFLTSKRIARIADRLDGERYAHTSTNKPRVFNFKEGEIPSELALMALFEIIPNIDEMLNGVQIFVLARNLYSIIDNEYTIDTALRILNKTNALTVLNLEKLITGINIKKLNKKIDDHIEHYGFEKIGVMGEVPWMYTVGLTNKVGFELLCIAAIGTSTIRNIVDQYANLALAGERIDTERTDVIKHTDTNNGLRTIAVKMDASLVLGEYVKITRGDVKEVYLIVLPDENNLFPGEEGYNTAFVQGIQ